MSYEHRSNVNPRRAPLAYKIILIVILILLVLFLFAPNFLSGVFTKIVSPFWNIGKPNTEEKASQLVLDDYRDAVITELEKENTALKSMLNRVASSTMTLAYVIKKPPFTAYDTFIIDVGEKENVYLGQKVYVKGDILLGEIAEINSQTSKVKLYSSYGEKYEALLGVGTSSENVQVTAIGRGGGSFEIVIPRDMKIKVGDAVTIPSLKVGIFGIVKKIVVDPAKTFSTVLFSQPINIYEIKWVELYQQ